MYVYANVSYVYARRRHRLSFHSDQFSIKFYCLCRILSLKKMRSTIFEEREVLPRWVPGGCFSQDSETEKGRLENFLLEANQCLDV